MYNPALFHSGFGKIGTIICIQYKKGKGAYHSNFSAPYIGYSIHCTAFLLKSSDHDTMIPLIIVV